MSPSLHARFGPRIDARDLFADERDALVTVLEGLDESRWQAATACPGWTVKDIAAHVVGDDVGRLARTRDGFSGVGPRDGEDLARFIDRINDEWVVAARRMSPQLLVACLRWTGAQVNSMWRVARLDDFGEPVSWAGPEPAPVWLDAARDVTEYWVHHQQIRESVGESPLLVPHVVGVVVDTFMRALPHTLRSEERPLGTRLTVVVDGPGAGSWTIERDRNGWRFAPPEPHADSIVRIDVDTAWRVCTRGIDPDTARGRAVVTGDEALGHAALEIVSIIRTGVRAG
jgi:uncharacterized protein (TIGR03083 family)